MVWRCKHLNTAVEIGKFSDPINEAFGVKTEAEEHQHHQQIIPATSRPDAKLSLNHWGYC